MQIQDAITKFLATQERIAAALEHLAAEGRTRAPVGNLAAPIVTPEGGAPVTGAAEITAVTADVVADAAAAEAAPKRTRRSKAEIEAAKAAATAAVVQAAPTAPPSPSYHVPIPPATPFVEIVPQAAPQVVPPFAPQAAPQVVQQAAPQVVQQAAPQAAPQVVQQAAPQVVPQTAMAPSGSALVQGGLVSYEYQNLPIEAQYRTLLELAGPYISNPNVHAAFTSQLSQAGLSLPISHPEDRARPGNGYVALPNERRYGIVAAVAAAVHNLQQNGGQ